jgi:hypothetical protein
MGQNVSKEVLKQKIVDNPFVSQDTGKELKIEN